MLLRFPKTARLASRGEFERLKREGRTFPGRFMVMSVLRDLSRTEAARVGIITTRKIGGAVVRNAVRRKFREVFRAARPTLEQGVWLVLIARNPAAKASLAAIQRDWDILAKKAAIYRPSSAPDTSALAGGGGV